MGMYVNGARYNCRVIFGREGIVMIRPKTSLANDGNYREGENRTGRGRTFMEGHAGLFILERGMG